VADLNALHGTKVGALEVKDIGLIPLEVVG
jgi:hypothetical protein